ncbi:DUP/COS family protein DI49_0065 [Saccharomyces eubayanus]|uniref:DUP/COS family protein n=1 Tax=Saccharomyces eubayanus TaxID=1080349 RepID=UPI0006C33F5B|nr:hypothetical protein DI49_0065 [Saccharomyces eubayanus]KOH01397.1 hypothetical protein DI49_0065 [Saccharomyces eubayanus]
MEHGLHMQSHFKSDDVNNDVKLCTMNEGISDEPNASLIADYITLPNNIFTSKFPHLFHEMAHFKPFVWLFLVLAISILSVVYCHNNVFYNLIVLVVVPYFMCLFALIAFNQPISDESFKIKLLMEVITYKPAVKGREWRTITYNMNQYLFCNGLWTTPYYFYSEMTCYDFFRTLIKGRISGTPSDSSTSDAENTQPEVPAADAPDDAARSHIFSPDPIFEAYYLKAVEVEKEAQGKYWSSQYPNTDIP